MNKTELIDAIAAEAGLTKADAKKAVEAFFSNVEKSLKQGKKVAIIEENPKMYGGTCINVGCLPTKSLVHSAKILAEAKKYGIDGDYSFKNNFFKEAMKKKEEMTTKLRNKIELYLYNRKKSSSLNFPFLLV